MSLRRTCCITGLLLLSMSGPVLAQDGVPDMDNATTIWDHACAACHGDLGEGTRPEVPDIRSTPLTLSQIMLIVKAGRNTMPAFAGFTPQELLDISTYVRDAL